MGFIDKYLQYLTITGKMNLAPEQVSFESETDNSFDNDESKYEIKLDNDLSAREVPVQEKFGGTEGRKLGFGAGLSGSDFVLSWIKAFEEKQKEEGKIIIKEVSEYEQELSEKKYLLELDSLDLEKINRYEKKHMINKLPGVQDILKVLSERGESLHNGKYFCIEMGHKLKYAYSVMFFGNIVGDSAIYFRNKYVWGYSYDYCAEKKSDLLVARNINGYDIIIDADDISTPSFEGNSREQRARDSSELLDIYASVLSECVENGFTDRDSVSEMFRQRKYDIGYIHSMEVFSVAADKTNDSNYSYCKK